MRLLRRLHPRQSASDVSFNRSKDLKTLTAISIKCPFKKATAKTGDRFRNTCNSISQIMKIASVANKGANNFVPYETFGAPFKYTAFAVSTASWAQAITSVPLSVTSSIIVIAGASRI